MATPHSGPYKTGDPNKPPEVRDFEAVLVLQAYRRGEPMEDIATRMGLSVRVAYRRLNDLIKAEPTLERLTVRRLSYERLEASYFLVTRAIEDAEELPAADLAKLINEHRKLVESMVRLMGANAPDTLRDDDDDLSDHENWSE